MKMIIVDHLWRDVIGKVLTGSLRNLVSDKELTDIEHETAQGYETD